MDWGYGLTMAIQYFDNNVTEMSERTGIDKDRLNYLRNRNAKKILLEEALIIEMETRGAVLWHQLVPVADHRVKQRLNGEATLIITHQSSSWDKKPFSQWIFEAMEYEKQFLDQRQGQRTDRTLREKSHEVKGRSDTSLTTLFDVGSEWKYRKGKKSHAGWHI